MLGFHLAVVAILVVARVASTEPVKNSHSVLGITPNATSEDIQHAYQKLALKHKQIRTNGDFPESWFVDVQSAYEELSGKDMHEDSLRFVDYLGDVTKLHDDVELFRFAEFQVEGSSPLRVIFVSEQPGQKFFEAFSTSIKFGHKVRVGTVSESETIHPRGDAGEYFASLKLRQFPAVMLVDVLTQGRKVLYADEMAGLEAEIQRALSGQLFASHQLGGIQELDQESYALRCQSAEAEAPGCSSHFIIATTRSLERRPGAMITAFRPFIEACHALRLSQPGAACFWLRLHRAPDWEKALRAKGVAFEDTGVHFNAFAVLRGETDEISMVPASVVVGIEEGKVTAGAFSEWFGNVIDGSASRQPLGAWIAPPKAMTRAEEPPEDSFTGNVRVVEYHISCVRVSACRAKQFDALHAKIVQQLNTYGLGSLYVKFMDQDPFFKGFVGLMCLLGGYFSISGVRRLFFGHKVSGTEEWTVNNMQLLVPVSLTRTEGQKFGIGFWTASAGGLTVTGVDKGGLLQQWNDAQTQLERQVREGDRVIFASGIVAGESVKSLSAKTMIQILQGPEANIMVERKTDMSTTVRLVGTCTLENLTLDGNVELKENRGETMDWEVVSFGVEVSRLNARLKSEGACCMQQLEIGDRIVSVNGNMNVMSSQGVVSPTLLLVRWRSVKSMEAKSVEVRLERSSPEESLGIQIRRRIAVPKNMEVLDVIQTGLLHKWNNTAGNPQIFKGDRIISVNGVTDSTGIQKSLRENKLMIVFERWVDNNSTSDNRAARDDFARARRRVSLLPAMPQHRRGSNLLLADAKGAAKAPGPALTDQDFGVTPGSDSGFSSSDSESDAEGTAPVQQGRSSGRKGKSQSCLSFSERVEVQELESKVRELEAKLAQQSTEHMLLAQRPGLGPGQMAAAPRAAPMPAQSSYLATGVPQQPSEEPPPPAIIAGGALVALVVVMLAMAGGGNSTKGGQASLSPVQSVLQALPLGLYMAVAAVLLMLGGLTTSVFARNLVCGSVLHQLCLSAIASMLLGFGFFLMGAWSGFYAVMQSS